MGNLAGIGLGFIVGNAPASAFSSTLGGVRWLGVAGKGIEFAGDAYGAYQAGQGLLDGDWNIGDVFNVASILLFGVSAASTASTFLGTARSVNSTPSTAGTTTRAIPGSDDGLRTASRTKARAVGHCGNSFPEGTLVLMADGTTKPIEEVEPGDQVLADNPLDDLPAQVQTVVGRSSSTTRTWTTVAIDQDGDGVADGDITSTPSHLIWTEDGFWEEAVELQVGDRLLAADGSWVQVTNIQSNTVEKEITFDLDVEDIDSYFIITVDGSVLVHNCDLPDGVEQIQFGGNANQSYHAFRHTQEDLGLDDDAVREAITAEILANSPRISPGHNNRSTTVISGNRKVLIYYTAFLREDGTLNIGSIIGPSGSSRRR